MPVLGAGAARQVPSTRAVQCRMSLARWVGDTASEWLGERLDDGEPLSVGWPTAAVREGEKGEGREGGEREKERERGRERD